MITSLLRLSRANRRSRPSRTRRTKIIISATTVIGVAALSLAGWNLYRFTHDYLSTCVNSGPTVVLRAGGECVGVTNGSYVFDPALGKVENAIFKEDERVRGSGRSYETVAFLLPISGTGGVELMSNIEEQLEGAYTAQYYANRNNVQGTTPLIQLLIASSGTQAAEYVTTDTIIENDVASQHLVAVAGIGVSLDTTVSEVQALTRHGIPVIGSTITSDAFDNIPGLVRVAPSNAQEVSAALKFIKPRSRTAILIQDVNQTDTYDTTLVKEFTADFPDATHRIISKETYDTTNDVNPNGLAGQEVANRIGQMISDICVAHPDVVLFAGRGRDLGTLITDLGNRPCTFPVTILTGDDTTDMQITAAVRGALADDVTLDYAAEANPDEWNSGSTEVIQQGRQGFRQFQNAFTSQFPQVSYNDGIAMQCYDAMLTSVTVIRLAGINATTNAVVQEFNAIRLSRVVLGASGPIMLSAIYQGQNAQGSNPVGKVVPILRLLPTGTAQFLKLES